MTRKTYLARTGRSLLDVHRQPLFGQNMLDDFAPFNHNHSIWVTHDFGKLFGNNAGLG